MNEIQEYIKSNIQNILQCYLKPQSYGKVEKTQIKKGRQIYLQIPKEIAEKAGLEYFQTKKSTYKYKSKERYVVPRFNTTTNCYYLKKEVFDEILKELEVETKESLQKETTEEVALGVLFSKANQNIRFVTYKDKRAYNYIRKMAIEEGLYQDFNQVVNEFLERRQNIKNGRPVIELNEQDVVYNFEIYRKELEQLTKEVQVMEKLEDLGLEDLTIRAITDLDIEGQKVLTLLEQRALPEEYCLKCAEVSDIIGQYVKFPESIYNEFCGRDEANIVNYLLLSKDFKRLFNYIPEDKKEIVKRMVA